jgi:hypothetical protein
MIHNLRKTFYELKIYENRKVFNHFDESIDDYSLYPSLRFPTCETIVNCNKKLLSIKLSISLLSSSV